MNFKESSIRPDTLFDEYLRLAKNDCIDFFGASKRYKRNCPICNSSGTLKFSKNDFDYSSCNNCQTIFIDPCPDEITFQKFYKESSSAKYWSSEFYKLTESSRKSLLWRPKFNFIKGHLDSVYDIYGICDIGCGYGAFLDIASEETNKSLLIGIEPNNDLAKVCIQKNHRILNCFLNDVTVQELEIFDHPLIFTCFELLEHLVDPISFLQSVYKLMKPGDYLFLTTLSSFGIDISILGANSKSISPPHHILFINPISARILAKKVGFSSCKIDTPGCLDFDILYKNRELFKESSPRNYEFISSVPPSLQSKFQAFIAENLLSSHIRLILTK